MTKHLMNANNTHHLMMTNDNLHSDDNVNVLYTTFISSTSPLTKIFSLDQQQNISKAPAAQMSSGFAIKKSIAFSHFIHQLNAANAHTAFGYGTADSAVDESIQLVSKKNLSEQSTAISRSKDYFHYQNSPGILMIDYDPSERGQQINSVDDFINIITRIFPDFADCAKLSRSSVSAGVYKSNKIFSNNNKGFHLYCPVENASDIPRFGKALFKKLWLADQGHIDISKSGSLLIRSIIDIAVFSPERLDFVAKPILKTTELAYQEATVFQKKGGYLKTEQLLDLTISEEEAVEKRIEQAKNDANPAATEANKKWQTTQIKKMMTTGGVTEVAAQKQIKTLNENNNHYLPDDFVLHFDLLGEATVKEVLNQQSKYNAQALADPFEGVDYGATTAKIWITKKSKKQDMFINSMAHGGCHYLLKKNKKKKITTISKNKEIIKLIIGEKVDIVNKCEQVLHKAGYLYEFCNSIVSVVSSKNTKKSDVNSKKIIPVDAVHLTELLMTTIDFKKINAKSEWKPTNLTPDYAHTLLSRKNWTFPLLSGMIYAPTLREDGSILQQKGYDQASSLYFDSKIDFPDIPEKPTHADALAALNVFKKPLEKFDFEADSDFSTTIAAILTALLRKSIDNAPLFLFNSPKMGCGKGLLANMVSQIATGNQAAVMSQTNDINEERKRLMSALLAGNQIICIDNIENNFQSETLCSVLTMPFLEDRLLGKTQMVSASTQVSFLATGNNVTVVGDLTRRVLPITIDPQCEKPYERNFDLHLPTYIAAHRVELVIAALTILRAYHVAGRPKQTFGTAFGSFEKWSDWIRSAIMWIGLDDPCQGLNRWEKIDPVRADVLDVFEQCYLFMHKKKTQIMQDFTVNHLINYANEYKGSNLYYALLSVAEKGGFINARKLGHWLVKNCNRIERMYRLESADYSGTRLKYRIKKIVVLEKYK